MPARTQNNELKETKGKLEGVDRQKEKLQKEVTTLLKKVETVGTDTIQKFKVSQSYIDSYADYYGTRFDDCLKQVTSTFPELDLSGITMDDPVSTSPIGDDIVDEGNGSPESNLPPKDDGVIVLAQPTANPPYVSTSTPPAVFVDVENPQSPKDDGTLLTLLLLDFALCVFHLFCKQCLIAPFAFGLLFVNSLSCYMLLPSFSAFYLLMHCVLDA